MTAETRQAVLLAVISSVSPGELYAALARLLGQGRISVREAGKVVADARRRRAHGR